MLAQNGAQCYHIFFFIKELTAWKSLDKDNKKRKKGNNGKLYTPGIGIYFLDHSNLKDLSKKNSKYLLIHGRSH